MDARVGEILDAVDDLHIRDNIIVVFTSDNGPEATWPLQGLSGPWRGYYFTHMEGSLRVPFIIRWPGRVPAGRVSNEIVHGVDTFTNWPRWLAPQCHKIGPSMVWIRRISCSAGQRSPAAKVFPCLKRTAWSAADRKSNPAHQALLT